MIHKGIQLPNPTPWSKFSILIIFLFAFTISSAQSCVCYRADYLNDYKDSDFVAHIKIETVQADASGDHIDQVKFKMIEIFRGTYTTNLEIHQQVGNGRDNSRCRLFFKPGDELVVYAKKDGDLIYTTPCMRTTYLPKNDPKFNVVNASQLQILRNLKFSQKAIDASNTRCQSLIQDASLRKDIEQIPFEVGESHAGLYRILFNEDGKTKKIEVINSFSEKVDDAIRIKLIKRSWAQCKDKEHSDLLIGYFFYPETNYSDAKITIY